MPSKGPEYLPDRRKNIELTEEEIQHQIAKRDEQRKRAKIQTISGMGLGVVGTVIAAYSGLVTGAIWMTVLGFVMALIGFGFTSPKEAAELIRGILGKNKSD